jgi:hypothetical protein
LARSRGRDHPTRHLSSRVGRYCSSLCGCRAGRGNRIYRCIAGVTGIGGGIFIAPLVLTLHWLNTRHAAGLSALFNLLNSAAALAGLWSTSLVFPPGFSAWLVAVAIGAILGSWLGVKHLPSGALRYILSALLLVGGVWMLLS